METLPGSAPAHEVGKRSQELAGGTNSERATSTGVSRSNTSTTGAIGMPDQETFVLRFDG